jgi:predicted short-subunit dehydrogenase-like oxidoreductase (DUF2520 family)
MLAGMTTSIVFIGAGRLGQTLATALERKGLDATTAPGRDLAAAQAAVRRADLVFLTVPDDAIAPLAARLPWRAGQRVVHCSGATEVSVLDPAVRAGALTGGFHPLQIFSDPARAAALLAGSTVAIEGPPPLEAELNEIAQRLGMTPLRLPPGARALYHGGASFAASFLLSMLEEAVDVWRSFGVAEQDALQALLPLARGTLDAATSRGLAGALAGPVSRGDADVVERHLQALQQLGPEHAAFYRELTRRQIELARASGRLDASQLERLINAASVAPPAARTPDR